MTKLASRPVGLSTEAEFVGIHEAKTQLSRLLREVEAGREITIMRGSTPVAKLVSVAERPVRELGMDAGRTWVSPDFDEGDSDLIELIENSEIFPR